MNEETEVIGFLIVQTVTANGALPVENALVHVYEYGDGSDKDALYTQKTDISGKTDKLALSAVDKSLSLSPEAKTPYKAYNVRVYADGYYESEKINVPVFQGITSIQQVNLIPLAEFSDPFSAAPDPLSRYTRIPNSRL
ncbi:MAG: hypothetical protein IKC74_01685 [Clostridia bacterium]|nr:hypothetical protein [Clostridia bacterium]